MNTMMKKVEHKELCRIIKAMTVEEQTVVALALKTDILKQELTRRELAALNLVDSVTDVMKRYLNEPADLDHSELLIKELRQVLKVKGE